MLHHYHGPPHAQPHLHSSCSIVPASLTPPCHHAQQQPTATLHNLLTLPATLPACPQGLPVTRLIITGCPLPSINRILERGLATFPTSLEQLEVHECAFRGDNLGLVTRMIRKHPALQSIKVGRALLPGHCTSALGLAGLCRWMAWQGPHISISGVTGTNAARPGGLACLRGTTSWPHTC